jgi:hypothetical protein
MISFYAMKNDLDGKSVGIMNSCVEKSSIFLHLSASEFLRSVVCNVLSFVLCSFAKRKCCC